MSDSSAQHPQQPSSWQSTTNTLQASSHLQASDAGPAPAQTYYPYYWPPQYSQYYRTTYPVSSSGQFSAATHPAVTRTGLPGQASSSTTNTVNSTDGKKTESLNGNAAGPIEQWDQIIRQFLQNLGLTQALAGFEADMLIMNSDWEKKKVPEAIRALDRTLQATLRVKPAGADAQASELTGTNTEGTETQTPASLLDERKLAYAHYSEGAKPRTPTQINKEISSFLARNRKRNDASNRTEFLRSLSEKRAALAAIELDSTPGSASVAPISSCARVDAKTIDRDVQMKYDIAKNEEGPLRKTIAPSAATSTKDKGKGKAVDNEDAEMPDENAASEAPVTATTHPALTERLQNVEKHFNVRYVPSPPLGLLDRLKLLEEHIIRLEKDYPPWAALHFNQPNRGWPPPPRSTPIIVPSNMKRVQGRPTDIPSGVAPSGTPSEEANRQGSEAPTKSKKSSLHRAVMEKLEVKQAMEDLAGSRA